MAYPVRKEKVLKAFLECFAKYNQVILVDLLNISTKQITQIRKLLIEQKGIFLVGKNTIALLAIKMLTQGVENKELQELQGKYARKPDLTSLVPKIVNKVAFVFTDRSYVALKRPIESEVVKVPAKAGILAPADVWVRAGPTSLDAGKFNEFQRLNIQTKISKQAIEIVKDFKICSKDEIVSENVSTMCRMLNIIPFEYGMKVQDVYLNGQFIPRDVIDMPAEDILASFQSTVASLAAISLQAGIVNSLSTPHIIANVFKAVLAIGLAADIKMPILETLSQAAASSAPAKDAPKGAPAKEAAKKPEPEPEPEEADMDLGDMFG